MVKVVKQQVSLVSMKQYWHCYLSRKIETILTQQKDEQFVEFGIRIENDLGQEVKYKMVFF